MTFIVGTTGDATRVVPSLQRAIWALNPAVSFGGIETLNGLLRDTLAARRFTLTLLSGFSLVAIVLASVGLYGLVNSSVSERTAEIGIRLALGSRYLATMLFGVTATDPLTFALLAAAVAVVSAVACYVPARRATRVDPLVAIRLQTAG